MRFRPNQLIVILAISCALTACGKAPKSFDVQRPVKQEPISVRSQSVNAIAVADGAVQTRRDEQIVFLVVAGQTKSNPVRQGPSSDLGRSPLLSVAATTSSGCGGDLPPCYVMLRESGGSYTAYNPTGCGGSGCYGKWQFSGEWAGKLGLPSDLATATPEQQDEAARQLWNNGAGCSNWAACG